MYKVYFLLGLIYLFWGWMMIIPNKNVKVIFCNVSQGDGALVTSGYFQMLIDVGPVKGNIEKCLDENLPLGDKKIEIVLLSHNDSDHVGAMENLEKYYKFDKIFKVNDLVKGDEIIGNNFKFRVIYPEAGLLERTNDSVVGILNFSNNNILFTGDIDELVENSIIYSIDVPIDVIKLSHHGSKTGNSEKWLRQINANYAIVSVGKNNYGHPSSEVMSRVLGIGTSLLRTDINGNLIVQ